MMDMSYYFDLKNTLIGPNVWLALLCPAYYTYILSDSRPGQAELGEEIPEHVDEERPDQNQNNKQSSQPHHGLYLQILPSSAK